MTSAEDSITRWFAEQSSLDPERFPVGIGDDMASVNVPGGQVLITTDILLDGTHFDLTCCTLLQAGRKAMAVSLSDCAAMATRPLAAVVSVALPKGYGAEQLKQLHAGIRAAGDVFGCALIGGDITSWPSEQPLAISVAMLSTPGPRPPVTRGGAREGDVICVTGSLGGAHLRRDGGKHFDFTPRVSEAIEITEMVAVNAMMDLSDGLSSDLARICAASKVGAIVESRRIPISEAAESTDDPLAAALNDGEDYELLLTLGKDDCERLVGQWRGETSITAIGEITGGSEILIRGANGQITTLESGGYDHLAG